MWTFCLVGTANRYWMLIRSGIVRSTLHPIVFTTSQWNRNDYQFHIKGENRSAEGHIACAGWSCDIKPILPPCPLSKGLDWAVCSDYVLPIMEGYLVSSYSPIPIVGHKSAIHSFQGHYNLYTTSEEHTVPFELAKFQSYIWNGVWLRCTGGAWLTMAI